MTSGYVYEPLRKIRAQGTSVELHIADMAIGSKFGFDEFVRLCAAASNADSIEASALSDWYRLYLLAFVKAPSKFEIIMPGVSQDEGEEEEEEEAEEEGGGGGSARPRRKANFTLVNQALKSLLLRYIDELEGIAALPDAATRAPKYRLFYAKVGAVMYAHQLLTYDGAVMPTDNRYDVSGNVIRVPRPSKLAARVTPELERQISIVSMDRDYIPYISDNQEANYYPTMIKGLRDAVANLSNNESLTLSPATDVLFGRYRSFFQSFTRGFKVVMTWRFEEDEVPKEFVKFGSIVNRVNESEYLPQLLATSVPQSLEQRTRLNEYLDDVNKLVLSKQQTQDAKILFDKLLQGYYLDDIDRERFPQYQPNFKGSYGKIEDRFRFCIVNVQHAKGTTRVGCFFQRVDVVFDSLFPSILAPEFLTFKSLTIPFGASSNQQLGRHALSDDVLRQLLTTLYVEYIGNLKLKIVESAEAADAFKTQLSDTVRDIYGDDRNTYNPRAGRVAFQNDALYFHFLKKYRWHRYYGDQQNDWLGRVVFTEEAFDANHGFMGPHDRPYSIKQNDSVNIQRTHFTGHESVKRARDEVNSHDTIRFNANVKREFILARAAAKAFENEPNAKVWLGGQDIFGVTVESVQAFVAEQPSGSIWGATLRAFGLAGKLEPCNVEVNLPLQLKVFGGRYKRETVEKDVTIVPITELDPYLSPSGRRRYHTEYVVFHNRPMTLKQIKKYVKHLTIQPPRASRTAEKEAAQEKRAKQIEEMENIPI